MIQIWGIALKESDRQAVNDERACDVNRFFCSLLLALLRQHKPA